MTDVFIPKETVSDDAYLIIRLYFDKGQSVRRGDLIVSLETSKAVFDIEAPEGGYIFYNATEGQRVKIGHLVACICDSKDLQADYFEKRNLTARESVEVGGNLSVTESDARFSQKALKLLREHNLDIRSFDHLAMVTAQDVANFLQHEPTPPPNAQNLRIVIVGGGNHSKVCIDLIRQNHQFSIEGVVYTMFRPAYDELMGVPVLGGPEVLPQLYAAGVRLAVVGVGGLDNAAERWNLYLELKGLGFLLPNLIHKSSFVEPSVVFGEGNQVLAGAVIGSLATIGSNCIINSNAVVSHDCVLGDNVHITPGALLAGTVKVGQNSIIGMGSSVFYGTSIGANTTVTNGKHIYKDLGDNQTIK